MYCFSIKVSYYIRILLAGNGRNDLYRNKIPIDIRLKRIYIGFIPSDIDFMPSDNDFLASYIA